MMTNPKVYAGGDTDDKMKGPQLSGLKAKEHYELKNLSGWQFPQPEHLGKIAKNPTFFDHEGHTHLDNLKQNELKEVGNKIEFYEVPLNEARHNRLKAFDGAMQPVLNTSLAEHNFEGLYDPAEEELIQVLNVNELIGLPSSTDEIHVKGSIGVALLRPRRDDVNSLNTTSVVNLSQPGVSESMAFDNGIGARLLFSVSTGTLEYSAAEGFQHVYFLCCGILGPNGCMKQSLSGTHVMTYAINSRVQGQLCTLPLRNTVIDCVAMSTTAQTFRASTAGLDGGPDCCTKCVAGCWSCCLCCYACYQCKFCPKCPSCTDCCCTIKRESESFDVKAEHIIGRDPDDFNIGHAISDNVKFTVSNIIANEAVIKLHYRSPYDFQYRQCMMRISGENPTKNFADAKKFASYVTRLRGPIFTHPHVQLHEIKRGFGKPTNDAGLQVAAGSCSSVKECCLCLFCLPYYYCCRRR